MKDESCRFSSFDMKTDKEGRASSVERKLRGRVSLALARKVGGIGSGTSTRTGTM